ncbi:lantibiotic dehydratase [Streptomyces sp. NPDC014735]|uniref:lantibiotic dehydratase n=1 Tax=unclassified Streptomyces TaxID=2593676 RepID=UPI0036F9B042
MAPKAVSYLWQGVALLRATTYPGPADVPRTLDLDDPVVTRAWLARVWQRDNIRDAVEAASPLLCQTVDDVVRGVQVQPRQIRRTALSVASYLLRWQHRPTPFGLFAGTAPVSVGPTLRVRWGSKHQIVVRADNAWITDVVQQLQQSANLLERLMVISNNIARRRGDRLVAPGPPADGRAQLLAPIEVSVRLSRPVQAAMHAARSPVRYRDLRDELTAMFPAGADGRIDTLLGDLISQNLLITTLRAPMTTVDSLGHICSELEKAEAHTLPDIGPLARELYAIRDDLAEHGSTDRTAGLSAAARRMAALSSIAPAPLLIDSILDCDVQIPTQVVAEAQAAVAALYRVSPLPYGYRQWRDYHRRFRARYGVGAAVPVLDLVADSGLGWPAEYVGSERGKAPRTVGDREDAVLALVQDALLEGRGELVLTDAVVADIAKAAGSEEPLFAPRTEVAFEVRAASPDALARGAFQLMLTGVPRPGSSMAGRFAHLLPPKQQEALAHSYCTRPDAITAQLSFSPRRRRDENVARTARLLPHVVSLSEHADPEDGVIDLADIAVTADARRFHLVQLSTGRPIDVRVLHALEAGVQTPPLARFLAEVATGRCAVYKPFDFGTAARLPYLPRVRYRRTILTAARWLLMGDDLPGRSAPHSTWEKEFTAWRTRLRMPDRIAMVEIEQRLPLDLTHPVHLRLLRSRLHEAGRLELREVADSDDYGWIGRAHEILVPLSRNEPTDSTALPTPRAVQAMTGEQAHLPGAGTVLRAHLHAHPERYDEILDRHLPQLLDAFGEPPLWWFTRHREMARPEGGQHLALFLSLPADTYGMAAEHVHRWADDLRSLRLASHLSFETYQPQTGRFGHAEALDAAHRFFASDSVAALAQIRLSARTDQITAQALAAASILDLVPLFTTTTEQGMNWLVENIPQGQGPINRTVRNQVLHLAEAGVEALVAQPGGDAVARAWRERADAAHAYRTILSQQRDRTTVIRSLLHQHHVRATGVDPTAEAATLRLARTAALRHTARADR